jgi:hypothetical protein
MTGTNCDLFTHKSSRSYLNHLLFYMCVFSAVPPNSDIVKPFLVTGNGGNTATFDLFDSESGQDLTLSPQTFTSSTEAFINDNSDSLGVPGDTDTGRPFCDL